MNEINNPTKKQIEIFYFLNSLKELSECSDKQVACIITDKNDNILSVGINKVRLCEKDKCLGNDNTKLCTAIHAEKNALNNLDLINHTRYSKAYISLCPCNDCQLLLSKSVDEIIYFGETHKEINNEIKDIIYNIDISFYYNNIIESSDKIMSIATLLFETVKNNTIKSKLNLNDLTIKNVIKILVELECYTNTIKNILNRDNPKLELNKRIRHEKNKNITNLINLLGDTNGID